MTEVSPRALFLMPSSVLDTLTCPTAGPWGALHVKWDLTQELGVIAGGTVGRDDGFESHSTFLGRHRSRYADLRTAFGVWYRTDPEVLTLWVETRNRQAAIDPELLATVINQGWKTPPADGTVLLVVTISIMNDVPLCSAWTVDHQESIPVQIIQVDEHQDPLQHLEGLWPVTDLRSATAVIIGLGSLGAPAALALAGYGIGRLILIDPDRLEQHNLVRHVLDASYLGHFKVAGLKEIINNRWPATDVTALALDVIDDADAIRPLIRDANIVVAAPDGVAPRQTINHLARWAQTPAVIAAVFDDGGFGEVIRVRPGKSAACLTCARTRLLRDKVMEPERTLDLGYGTGRIHRPMTAVGPDVALIGDLAAKVAVATILEDLGHKGQELEGDHLVVGLRPTEGLQSPFDVLRPLDVKWHPIGAPEPNCPDCSPS